MKSTSFTVRISHVESLPLHLVNLGESYLQGMMISIHMHGTLSDGGKQAYQLPSPHENRVSCLGVNPKGDALCTGSWDTFLKVKYRQKVSSHLFP